ncbi:MAG: hypothetical protein KAQ94_09475 [Arcobacteraceae bacterium]|nr:hypothetical protein [Arcobacteraceae bacterium]
MSISKESVSHFIKKKKKEKLLRYMFKPDYYIISKVKNIKILKSYQYNKEKYGLDINKNIIVTGKFIDAVNIN